jgi:hypothetical protein
MEQDLNSSSSSQNGFFALIPTFFKIFQVLIDPYIEESDSESQDISFSELQLKFISAQQSSLKVDFGSIKLDKDRMNKYAKSKLVGYVTILA